MRAHCDEARARGTLRGCSRRKADMGGSMHPAGWYTDPGSPGQLRYWDGYRWTDHTHPHGPPGPWSQPSGYTTAPGPVPAPTWTGYPAQPVVAAKNPAVSLIVSFFLPGVGSMINGDVGTGVAILLIWLISIPLTFFLIGFFTLIGAFIWGLVDAYQGARRWNARHGIIS